LHAHSLEGNPASTDAVQELKRNLFLAARARTSSVAQRDQVSQG
jgi:hypothetical protein